MGWACFLCYTYLFKNVYNGHIMAFHLWLHLCLADGERTQKAQTRLCLRGPVSRGGIYYTADRVEMSHNNDFHSSSAPPRICWDWWCGPRAWKQLGQEVLWHISPRQVATNVMLFCVWNMGRAGGGGGESPIEWKEGPSFLSHLRKRKSPKSWQQKIFSKLGYYFSFSKLLGFFLY